MRPTLKKSEVHELLHNTVQQLKECYSVEFEELKTRVKVKVSYQHSDSEIVLADFNIKNTVKEIQKLIDKLNALRELIIAEKTYDYLNCPDPDLTGMHCAFITVDDRDYYCPTDGISHTTACDCVYEDDDIIILTKEQFEEFFEPVPSAKDADELKENIYVVVHYTTNEDAIKAVITDVPEDVGSEELKERLEKAGYEFGEFNIAWANHYVAPLRDCSESVINAAIRILRGSTEPQSLGKLVFQPIVLSYKDLEGGRD